MLIDKKFITDARLNYFAQLLNICLGFISVTLVVKFAGLVVYGMMAVMVALGATVTNLVSFRTNEALVKFYRQGMARGNGELQYFAIAAGLIMDFVTGFFMLVIIQTFAGEIASQLLKSAGELDAVVLFSYIAATHFLRGTGYGLLNAQERFKIINLLAVLEQATKVAFIGWGMLFLKQPQLHTILLLMLAASVPFTFFYFIISSRRLLSRPLRRWMRAKWMRLYWDFSMSTFVSSTLKSGHKNLDAVILGYFSSPATVGVYNLFKQFISPVDMLAAPYASQIYPKFVDALRGKTLEPVELAIQQGSRTLCLQGSIVMLFVLPIAYAYFAWNGIEIARSDYFAFFMLLAATFMIQSLWWTRSFSLATCPRNSITANAIALTVTVLVMPVAVYLLGGILGAATSMLITGIFLYLFWGRKLIETSCDVFKNS